MTARVLVVDDIEANVRLLEARLMSEYFQVLTARNGLDAIEICRRGACDIVLLDVMMPQMDGFEVCRRLKSDLKTMHLPVVMVTALDQTSDRVNGLECGADDFLTKPVDDLAMVTRIRSLVRLKMLSDELRMRSSSGDEITGSEMLDLAKPGKLSEKGNVVIVDDRASSYERPVKFLSKEHNVSVITNPVDALIKLAESDADAVIVALSLANHDALRLCSQIRSLERTRLLPILLLADLQQDQVVRRALEIGINDFITRPIDVNELNARIRTLIKRKRYNDSLRQSVQHTIEMAVTDSMTGLHNRRYLDSHFQELIDKAESKKQPLSVMICDIDHFKQVNDDHGHDVGDEVIVEFAQRLKKSIRGIDLSCRYGGEEFVVIMPDTSAKVANIVGERIRQDICNHPFITAGGSKQLPITVSIGVSTLSSDHNTPEILIKRADECLYEAKRAGRNQVVSKAA